MDSYLEEMEGREDLHELLSCQDVADYLKLHVKTVREYIMRGELRAKRMGKYYRIRKEWVIDFLERSP